MKGKLFEKENGWVIQYKMEPDLISTDGGEIPIHSYHSFWLKIWGENGAEFNFELDESGFALLRSENSMKNYPQD